MIPSKIENEENMKIFWERYDVDHNGKLDY